MHMHLLQHLPATEPRKGYMDITGLLRLLIQGKVSFCWLKLFLFSFDSVSLSCLTFFFSFHAGPAISPSPSPFPSSGGWILTRPLPLPAIPSKHLNGKNAFIVHTILLFTYLPIWIRFMCKLNIGCNLCLQVPSPSPTISPTSSPIVNNKKTLTPLPSLTLPPPPPNQGT